MNEVQVASWIEAAVRKRTSSQIAENGTRQFTPSNALLYTPWNSTMSDNRKQEKDFTPEVDAILPEATSLVQVCLLFRCTQSWLHTDPWFYKVW